MESIEFLSIGVALLVLLAVIELVRRRALSEELSIVWLLSAGCLLVLATQRELLHALAELAGIQYPPALLLLALILAVFIGALAFSVVVSRQRLAIERLVEQAALLDERLRRLEAEPADEAKAALRE